MGGVGTGTEYSLQHLQLGQQLGSPHSLLQLRHLHGKHKDVEAIFAATGHKVALTGGQGVQAIDATAVSLHSQAGAAQLWRRRGQLSGPSPTHTAECMWGAGGSHSCSVATHGRAAQGPLQPPGQGALVQQGGGAQKAKLPSVARCHRNSLLETESSWVRGWEATGAPPAHVGQHAVPLTVSLIRGLVCEEACTLRTQRLWWKVSASSCSKPPRVLQRKSLGAGVSPAPEATLNISTPFPLPPGSLGPIH